MGQLKTRDTFMWTFHEQITKVVFELKLNWLDKMGLETRTVGGFEQKVMEY